MKAIKYFLIIIFFFSGSIRMIAQIDIRKHNSSEYALVTIVKSNKRFLYSGEIIDIRGDTVLLKTESELLFILKRDINKVEIREKYMKSDSLNVREQHQAGINLNIGGPTYYGSINFDYFLTKNLSLEVGGMILPIEGGNTLIIGAYGGTKIYAVKKNHALYTGLIYNSGIISGGGSGYFYFPLGYQYIYSKIGLVFAIERAVINDIQFNDNVFFLNQLRFGYRF